MYVVDNLHKKPKSKRFNNRTEGINLSTDKTEYTCNGQHFFLFERPALTAECNISTLSIFLNTSNDSFYYYNTNVDKLRPENNNVLMRTYKCKDKQSYIKELAPSMPLVVDMQQATLVGYSSSEAIKTQK